MKAQRHIQLLQQAVERVPIVGVPIATVDVIGPDKGADRAVFLDAAIELGAGKVDIVHRQHRRHFQLVRAVLAEIVQPVVVGAADRSRELRLHIVARHKGKADRREQHGDVDPFHRHAHDLSLGIIATLDREHDILVAARADQRAADAVVLRDDPVIAQGLAVEIPGRAAAHAGGAALHPPQGRGDARLEFGVEIFLEQLRRLHDVHVAIDKAVALFHPAPPSSCWRNGAPAGFQAQAVPWRGGQNNTTERIASPDLRAANPSLISASVICRVISSSR